MPDKLPCTVSLSIYRPSIAPGTIAGAAETHQKHLRNFLPFRPASAVSPSSWGEYAAKRLTERVFRQANQM
jgi:hypothetical protein